MKKTKWQWHISGDIRFSAPETIPADAEIVQESPFSLVYKIDGYFFKYQKSEQRSLLKRLKYTFYPRAKKEFIAIRRLQTAGLPVVEAVGYGSCGAKSILITKEVPDSITVLQYIRNLSANGECIDTEFLVKWGKFINEIIHSGFYIADFHAGNVLYLQSEKCFVLVDVYGLKDLSDIIDRTFARLLARGGNTPLGSSKKSVRRQKRMLSRQTGKAAEILSAAEMSIVKGQIKTDF